MALKAPPAMRRDRDCPVVERPPVHKMKGELDYLVDSYERGELTEG